MAAARFTRGNEGRNNRVIPVLALRLALWEHGCLGRFFVAAMDANRDLATPHLNLQFEWLITESIKMVPGTPSVLIAHDALDDCEDKAFVRTILKLVHGLEN
ncbi:hypothetical protein FRB96_003855, partial [Tulasnella sp. 330]